jgi:uncharacterized RDD family membrane protein YckC
MFILVFLIFITIVNAYVPSGLMDNDIAAIVWFLVYMLPILFYDLYMEYLLNGQTPGKKLMKIRVVRLDGEKPELRHFAIRWAFRVVESASFFGGIVPISSYLLTSRKQRLGDLAADTTVIKVTDELYYSSAMLRDKTETYVPFFRDTSWATRQDIQLMYHVLHKVFTKYPDRERQMLSEIAEMLSDHYLKENPASGIDDLKDISNTKLVRIFAFDYNYYEAMGGSGPQLESRRISSRGTDRYIPSLKETAGYTSAESK